MHFALAWNARSLHTRTVRWIGWTHVLVRDSECVHHASLLLSPRRASVAIARRLFTCEVTTMQSLFGRFHRGQPWLDRMRSDGTRAARARHYAFGTTSSGQRALAHNSSYAAYVASLACPTVRAPGCMLPPRCCAVALSSTPRLRHYCATKRARAGLMTLKQSQEK